MSMRTCRSVGFLSEYVMIAIRGLYFLLTLTPRVCLLPLFVSNRRTLTHDAYPKTCTGDEQITQIKQSC